MWTMPHTRERSHVDDRREALERSNASTRRPRVLLTPANPHRRFEPRVREELLGQRPRGIGESVKDDLQQEKESVIYRDNGVWQGGCDIWE